MVGYVEFDCGRCLVAGGRCACDEACGVGWDEDVLLGLSCAGGQAGDFAVGDELGDGFADGAGIVIEFGGDLFGCESFWVVGE